MIGMASEAHTIKYQGSVSDAGLLVQMLEVRGVSVDWEGRPEKGRAYEVVSEDVVNLASTGADKDIKAAARVFRARVPRARVEIDDPGQVQSERTPV